MPQLPDVTYRDQVCDCPKESMTPTCICSFPLIALVLVGGDFLGNPVLSIIDSTALDAIPVRLTRFSTLIPLFLSRSLSLSRPVPTSARSSPDPQPLPTCEPNTDQKACRGWMY
eukprot:1024664-Rhodomonas_salina.2